MNSKIATLIGFILLAALSRFLPHFPNFTPMMALALFSGAFFTDKKQAFLIPLAAMFLSDFFLGFHNLMPLTYLCFAVTVGMGMWLQQHRSAGSIAFTALASSVLFFTVTNFGVWAFSGMYSKSAAGLATCYIAALPFFQNSLMGDALYTVTLFGGFALLERMVPKLRTV
ncbi:MAG: hypothetical protein HY540_04415 [Deltaproteobacteria bacterium]|nr:hypothetical protein [Deltaproteobacteria bacterium]